MSSAQRIPGMRVIVVSGLSGSGKSTALRALEDCGFFCVDNLPPALLPPLIELCNRSSPDIAVIGVGMDIREGSFLADVEETLAAATASGHTAEVLFLSASSEALIRRFGETRRRHPLDDGKGAADGIKRERELVRSLRLRADRVIDTTQMNVHELRRSVQAFYGGPDADSVGVRVLSFGFKHGVPTDANLMLDVRFLPNPHFIPELQPKDGRDPAVADHALGSPTGQELVTRYLSLLQYLLGLFESEGRPHITVAVGCTGGRHRSVAVAERLADGIRGDGRRVSVEHRDVERE
jgi:UPF0042 nucleotide-binding protein